MKYVLRLCVLAAAMLMAIPGPARAADMGNEYDSGIKTYVGLGAGVYDLDFSMPLLHQTNNVAGAFLRLGADFNDYLGAELRVGASDRGISVYPGPPLPPGYYWGFKLRARYLFSYLAKLQFPVTPQFSVYGLVGGTTGNVTAQGALQFAGRGGATGLSYGGGIDYKVDDFMSIGLDYMSYWHGVNVGKSIASPYPATMNIQSYAATLRIMM